MKSLDREDMRHVHKVLRSDTKECEVFIRVSDGGPFVDKMRARMEANARVMARLEEMAGCKFVHEDEVVSTLGAKRCTAAKK